MEVRFLGVINKSGEGMPLALITESGEGMPLALITESGEGMPLALITESGDVSCGSISVCVCLLNLPTEG